MSDVFQAMMNHNWLGRSLVVKNDSNIAYKYLQEVLNNSIWPWKRLKVVFDVFWEIICMNLFPNRLPLTGEMKNSPDKLRRLSATLRRLCITKTSTSNVFRVTLSGTNFWTLIEIKSGISDHNCVRCVLEAFRRLFDSVFVFQLVKKNLRKGLISH